MRPERRGDGGRAAGPGLPGRAVRAGSRAGVVRQRTASVHAEVNRIWPRRLGTTPMGMARALTAHSAAFGIRYGWRMFRGRRDRLADVLREVNAGWPVAMLIGRSIPRHWVLVVGAAGEVLSCYEPSSGEVRPAGLADIRAVAVDRAGLSAAVRFRVAAGGHPIGDEVIAGRAGFLEAGDDARPISFGLVLRHLRLAFDAGDD